MKYDVNRFVKVADATVGVKYGFEVEIASLNPRIRGFGDHDLELMRAPQSDSQSSHDPDQQRRTMYWIQTEQLPMVASSTFGYPVVELEDLQNWVEDFERREERTHEYVHVSRGWRQVEHWKLKKH